MSTLTHKPSGTGTGAATARRSPLRLRGFTWLIVRQHRAMLLLMTAITVLGAAWIIYQRGASLDAARGAGWPAREVSDTVAASISNKVEATSTFLNVLPIVLAVFCGAPLIAADQEQGTAQLATTQSLPRGKWLIHKLLFGLTVVLVPTIVLGALHLWWWRAVRGFGDGDWLWGTAFGNTGPMPAALTLFSVVVGIAIGLVARRVLVAMVGTFLFAAATKMVWTFWVPEQLATPRQLSYPLDSEPPSPPSGAVELGDQWVATASGEIFSADICTSDDLEEYQACLADKGVVKYVTEYFGYDQMPGMQWTGAGILAGLSVLVITFVVIRVGRRPL